jgi:SPP1 gp7 family putative phage head morphogenesis protein
MPESGIVRRGFLARLFGPALEAPPQQNGNGTKAATGVNWVGSPAWRRIIDLDNPVNADAENLTRALAFATSAYCYIAMTWRASRVSEPPLMVVQETDDGEKWQPDHELVPLLEDPRPDIEMAELLQRTLNYLDLTGGALWTWSLDGVDRPAFVTPWSAAEFRTAKSGDLIYGRYEVWDGDQWRPIPREQVIHFREVNPASWRVAVSRVDAVLQQLNLGHHVNRIVRSYLEKALFTGGVISPHQDWHPSPEEWDLWKESVEEWHAGPANAGRPLFLQGGTTVSRVASGLTDLLPGEVLDRVEATVSAGFGVPPVVLGWLVGLKNSPWSNIEEARKIAYQDTVEPIWRNVFEKRLTKAWLTPEERRAGFMVRFDTGNIRALQQDEERQARIAALAADVATVNERRLMLDLEPLPPDDDRGELIVGLQPSVSTDGLGEGDDSEDVEDDPDEEEVAAGEKSTDAKDLLWLLFALEAKAAERTWSGVIYAHLQELRARILTLARRTFGVRKAADDAQRAADFHLLVNGLVEESRKELQQRVYPLLVSTGGSAVRRLSSRIRVSFRVLEPGLLQYAREESAFLASVMGKRTGEAVAKAVQDGLAAGETIAKLTDRLAELPAFDRTRAKLVARTETTRAWNGAQRRSLSEFQRTSGKRVRKTWLSSRDARVREEHAALDGEERGIDETFSNGLTEPGEPNCRCTLTYTVTEADGSGTDVEG